MGGVVDAVTDTVGGLFGGGGDDGAGAARDAAGIQAQYQREALDYLKEREAVPQQFREDALGVLGGLYGFGGSPGASAATLRASPMYQATIGQIPAQEEAILRNQAATGALRSSATEAMLAENQRQNQLQAYQNALQPLSGLANLPSNAGQIAQQTSNIGQTLGQGIIGAAQSQAAGQQAGFNNLLGLGSLGLSAFSAFCDPALKSNAKKIGEMEGYSIYEWDWNDKAKRLGLEGKGRGPMADEIERFEPERIEIRNGYKYVRAA